MSRLMQLAGLALLALTAWLAWPAAGGVAYAHPVDDAAAGKVAWGAKACKSCHGANAEGKYARALAAYDKTAQDVINQVRNPRNAMPMFNETQVTDQQLRDIFDYFKSLSPVTFTAVAYVPQPG